MKRIISLSALIIASSLFSNPSGMHVVAGKASVDGTDGPTLRIEAQDKTVINWDNFSIGPQENCIFLQPNATSAVLNRVTGLLPTNIHGVLQSNGKVFLINPQGILIGKNATIDTASFLASTLDLKNEDFISGNFLTFENNTSKSLVNLGTIHASEGDITLLGYIVKNEGKLEAKGNISIGVGEKIIIKPASSENIFIETAGFQIDTESPIGLENTGSMIAQNIEMASDGNIYALAIKDSGTHDALAITQEGGKILLKAKNGDIETTGSFKAQATDGKGGSIAMHAKNIILDEKASLDVSSPSGEGRIVVGNLDANDKSASHIFIHENASLKADATKSGNGGKILVRSENGTEVYGSLSVKGGPEGGDGGFIDLSSKEGLKFFTNHVYLDAVLGKPGLLYFDPIDVVIDQFPFSSNPSWRNPYPGAGSYVGSAALNVSDLISALNSGSVLIDNASGVLGNSGIGNITINRDIVWNNHSTLNISAYKNIFVNAAIRNTKEKSQTSFVNFTTMRGNGGDIIINGPMTANCESSTGPTIHMEADGNLEIKAPITLLGQPENNGDPNIVFNTVEGDIKIQDSISTSGNHELAYDIFCTSADQLMIGGADGKDVQISSNGKGNVLLRSSNDLSIFGGQDSSAQVLMENGGNCTLQSTNGSVVLEGGKGNISNASCVVSQEGNLLIEAKQNVQMLGNSALESQAYLEVQEGNITINAEKDFLVKSGSLPTSNSKTCIINHSTQSGSIEINANQILMETHPSLNGESSIILENGTGSLTLNAQDIVQLKANSQPIVISSASQGDMNISCSGLEIGANLGDAKILYTGQNGNLYIEVQEKPTLLSSYLATASVEHLGTASGELNFCVQGPLILTSDQGKTLIARQASNGALSKLNILSGPLTLNGLATSDNDYSVYIKHANGSGDFHISSCGINLLGNAAIINKNLDASHCYLDLNGQDLVLNALSGKNAIVSENSNGNLFIQNANNVYLMGGSIENSSVIVSNTSGDILIGNESLYIKGDLLVQGGLGTNSFAKILCDGGNINAYVTKDLNIVGHDLASCDTGIYFSSQTKNVNLNLYANNFHMFGGSTIQVTGSSPFINKGYPSCTIDAVENISLVGSNETALSQILILGEGHSDLKMLAGKDFYLKNYSSIENSTDGRVEIVADNIYPLMPYVGKGGIYIDELASVASTHNILLYTSRPENTSILGTLNDSLHFYSPVSTDQHHYFAYYPSPHLAGGPGYICFYKSVAPGMEPGGYLFNAIFIGQIINTELFYRLNNRERMFSIDPYNFYIKRYRSFEVTPLEPLSKEEVMTQLIVQEEIQKNPGEKL
jgi:filamentous hemagglutinin family protein